MVDIAVLVILGIFAYAGWRRGLLRVAVALVGLLLAYAAALLCFRPAGQWLGELFGLQPLIAWPLGGAAVFGASLLLWGAVNYLARNLYPCRSDHPVRHAFNRLGGLLLGLGQGGVFSVFLVWALVLADALLPELPIDMERSLAARGARPALAWLSRTVALRASGSSQLAAVAARFTRDPEAMVADVRQLAENPQLQRALADPRVLQGLAAGDWQRLTQSRRLRALARDPDFVAQLQRTGLLSGAVADGQMLDPQALADPLAPLARVAVGLQRHPEARRLLADPELARKLQRQDLLELANDPKFNRLVEFVGRLLRDEPLPVAEDSAAEEPAAEESSALQR